MAEQRIDQAPAGWLKTAVEALQAEGIEVLAPTAAESGAVDLAPVTSAEQISLDYVNTTLPLKRVFFPITEVLLEFENRDDGDVDIQPTELPSSDEVVVIGSRPCDAAAADAVDKVFQWDYDDVRYRARRERTTLVSFACITPSPECFCTSVGGSPHGGDQSDVVAFLDQDGGALLQVFSAKGEKLIERLGDAAKPAPDGTELPQPPEIAPRFDPAKVKSWLDENFESDFWAERSLGCLGCGACAYLCPTCHCFDIVDESTWNRGQRRRNWDYCASALFTKHASGHNPRTDMAARYRQRIMHKFKYFPERFDRIACVGCGRCVKVCGVGRNLAAALSDIESKQEGSAAK